MAVMTESSLRRLISKSAVMVTLADLPHHEERRQLSFDPPCK